MGNAEIEIQTGLHDFIMLDRIQEIGDSYIVGTRFFPSNTPVYLGLESLAQLGAFHVRYLMDFTRHIFLLKIATCSFSRGWKLEGEYLLRGRLISRSDLAFRCGLKAEKEGKTVMEGEFLFASVDYNENFRKEILDCHYRGIFSCLHNGSKPA